MKHLLGNDQLQVVTDSNPYLCKDRILRRSEERLDMQVLLNPLEERLNLPALPIKFCYSKRINNEVVGQKSVHIVRGKVFIYNHAHHLWIVLGDKLSSEPDTLVADKTCMHIYFPFLHDLKMHVVLRPCDEVCLPEMEEVVESPEVQITLVHQIVGTSFNRQYVKAIHVVDFPLRHPDKGGNRASEIQKRMHLHCTAILLVFCPRAEFQAECYSAAVKGIDHVVNIKSEAILCIERAHLFDKDLSQFRIDMPISELIRLSQSVARNGIANATVIQLMGNSQRIQACLYITQTILISILGQAHDQQLAIAGEVSHPEIASVLGNNPYEV